MKPSIEIAVPNLVSEGFKEAFDAACRAKDTLFTYGDAFFQIAFKPNGRLERVSALLELDAPLPKVFQGELSAGLIVLKAGLPEPLQAKQGWYVGDNFGFPGACCSVLAPSRLPTEPPIYANGMDLEKVTSLFRRVMTGELEPGYGDDPFSGKVYR